MNADLSRLVQYIRSQGLYKALVSYPSKNRGVRSRSLLAELTLKTDKEKWLSKLAENLVKPSNMRTEELEERLTKVKNKWGEYLCNSK